MNISKQLNIPHDSNLRYLPLVYFLPEVIIVKCPTLYAVPRKVREVLYSDDMMTIVDSDAFLNEIMDATAAMVFPHFGFSGWKEHYTGFCPVWKLSYSLPIWSKLLEAEIGWGLQSLFDIPSPQSIPFFAPEYTRDIMGRVVKHAICEEGWQPILDVIREMPCDEDFEKWNTNVRKDFARRWYHTRSKKVQTVSLEACIEDDNHHIHEIVDPSSDFIDHVISDDFYSRFKERLAQKDIEILEFRVQGFTYDEIAERMGYRNHSGVQKRIKAITQAFLQYSAQQ